MEKKSVIKILENFRSRLYCVWEDLQDFRESEDFCFDSEAICIFDDSLFCLDNGYDDLKKLIGYLMFCQDGILSENNNY